MDIENEVEKDIRGYESRIDSNYTEDINLFRGIKESLETEDHRSPYELLNYVMSI